MGRLIDHEQRQRKDPESGRDQAETGKLKCDSLPRSRCLGRNDRQPAGSGGPDTIRTCDLPLRRGTLYPSELRGRNPPMIAEQGVEAQSLAGVQMSCESASCEASNTPRSVEGLLAGHHDGAGDPDHVTVGDSIPTCYLSTAFGGPCPARRGDQFATLRQYALDRTRVATHEQTDRRSAHYLRGGGNMRNLGAPSVGRCTLTLHGWTLLCVPPTLADEAETAR
jgi:hypothetical protein